MARYDELRALYRPDEVRVLLVAESPPDPGEGPLRFFYDSTLVTGGDNLYRGVAEAVYGNEPAVDVNDKVAVLRCLQRDGFWLIDAVQHSINKLKRPARRDAIRSAAPELVARIQTLAPTRGVVICHGGVFDEVAPLLPAEGVHLLHDAMLPFPMAGGRKPIIRGLRQALRPA